MLPKRSSLLVVTVAAGAVALTGCGLGDGPRTTQTRDVGSFQRVDARGPVDVTVHVGGTQRVQVHGGKDVVGKIRTTVDDGVLRVQAKDLGWSPHGDLGVDVTVPRLDGVKIDGSGDLDADGLRGDAFVADVDGSGDLTLAGSVRRATVAVDGSGDTRASGLRALDAKLDVHGSGDTAIGATQSLALKIDGSGDVRYSGSPRLTSDVHGSGDVKQVR